MYFLPLSPVSLGPALAVGPDSQSGELATRIQEAIRLPDTMEVFFVGCGAEPGVLDDVVGTVEPFHRVSHERVGLRLCRGDARKVARREHLQDVSSVSPATTE